MAYPTTVTNTGQNLIDQSANNEAKLWKKGAEMFEQTEDVFTKMEGGPDALIETESDTSKGMGQTVIFRVRSGYYGPGRMNNQLYTDPAHFEETKMGTNTLKVGFIRNGTQEFFLQEEDVGMRGELFNGTNEELGKWMGREKTFQMCQSLVHETDIGNHLVVNGRGTIASLVSGDGLSVDDIKNSSAMLEPMGGLPAYIGTDGDGNAIYGLCYLTTTQGALSLEQDPDYKQQLLSAGVRDLTNPIFKGGLVHVGGNIVKKWNVIDHDGVGPVGSPLNPKAYLGKPIVDGTGVDLTGDGDGITGGGDAVSAALTLQQYFRFFPRYAFAFVGGTTMSATASTHLLETGDKFYVTVVNPATDATAPNKWCIYRCTVNNGNKLTVDQRLGSAINGSAHTTVGNVTYDSAVNTTTHPAGALVYWSNADGKPLFRTIGMGRRAARRAYGQFRNKRMTGTQEGGALKETWIGSIFGQKPRRDRRERVPAVIVLIHTGKYEGWKHP